MSVIILSESAFLLLIAVRLAYLARKRKQKLNLLVRLIIWLGIVICLASCFQRLNDQYGIPHVLDLIFIIICFIFLYLPVVNNVKWNN